jgi:hypothetical protein
VLLSAALAASLCFSHVASADSSSSVHKSQNPQLQARTLFKEAEDLQKAGNLQGALAKLEEAYEVLPTPTLLWPIAELHLQLEQPIEGLSAIQRYRQEMVPAEMEPGQQPADADKLEEKLRAQLAYLRLNAPAGAHILLDGKEVGRAPLPDRVTVNPGSHRLSTTDRGGAAELTVEARAGEEVAAELAPAPVKRGYFPHPLTWAAIGLTSACLFATTIVGGIAITDIRNLQTSCPNGLCLGGNQSILTLNSEVNDEKTSTTVAAALLGVTSLLAVGTTVLIIYDWHRQRTGRKLLSQHRLGPNLSLLGPVPLAAPDGAGFALGGRF